VGDLQGEDSELSGEARGWVWHSSFLERVGHGGGEPDALEHLALLQFGAGRDVATRRVTMEAGQVFMESMRAMPSDVKMTDFEARASDGAAVALRWYEKEGSAPGSAALYLHGGGMILSNIGLYDGTFARYVSASGVPMLSVEYRYAPEYPGITPVEDSYVALHWLAEHGAQFGVDPSRIGVMGDSAGGGIAAALALLARDRVDPPSPSRFSSTRCSTIVRRFPIPNWCHLPGGPTKTISLGGVRSSEKPLVAPTSRHTLLLLVWTTLPICRRSTSKWVGSTSSGTSAWRSLDVRG